MCECAGSRKFLTPIGELEASSCSRGLHSLHLNKVVGTFPDHSEPAASAVTQHSHMENDVMRSVQNWLVSFFKDPSSTQGLETPALCCLQRSPQSFRAVCWLTLHMSIFPGETISYGDLASLCKSPRAARAVGSAMKHNPVVLIIPCHRVVKSGGQLGSYSAGGPTVKQWLLDHEHYGK